MMLNIIMQLAATQVPVPIDPDLIYDLIASDRGTRERLRAYAEKATQAQAITSKGQMDMLKKQADAEVKAVDVKAGVAIADAKHDQKQLDQSTRLELVKLWLQAEESEKKFIIDMMKTSAPTKQEGQ
jgi:hypothetical protein